MSKADQIRNTLRVVALATTDAVARECCLDALEETESEAKSALDKTCWGDSLDELREALVDNNEHSDQALAKRRWNADADQFNQWDELGQSEKDGLIVEERNRRSLQKRKNTDFETAIKSALGVDVFLKTNTPIQDVPAALRGFDCQRVQVRNGGTTETWERGAGGWRKQPRIGCYEDLCSDCVEFSAYTVAFGGGGDPIDGDGMLLSLSEDEATDWLRHMERYKFRLEDAIPCSIQTASGHHCALAVFPLGEFKTMVEPDAIWGPRVIDWVRRLRSAGADEVSVAISYKKKPDETTV